MDGLELGVGVGMVASSVRCSGKSAEAADCEDSRGVKGIGKVKAQQRAITRHGTFSGSCRIGKEQPVPGATGEGEL